MLYFYPKDNTPPANSSVNSHGGFKAKLKFPFELLSDAMKDKLMYGRKVRGIERSMFVLDGKGGCCANGAG